MVSRAYDLWFDANSVDASMIVDTFIAHGPRADDAAFDPQVGQTITVGDGDEPPTLARVIERDGDRVRVQIDVRSVAVIRPADVA